MTDTVAVSSLPGSWEFTPDVAAGFDEHVNASVPFYSAIQDIVAEAADWLAPRHAVIADLGAATGTTAALIDGRHGNRDYRIHLYDESEAMLAEAGAKLAGRDVSFHHGRLEEIVLAHPPASLTVALFTLQFIDPADRSYVLASAREASRPDGAFILAEKLRLSDPRWTEIGISVSHDQKERAGVAAPAIRAKERSLRGVLIPWTDRQNHTALTRAGWGRVETLFRWHQWAVYGAFATP